MSARDIYTAITGPHRMIDLRITGSLNGASGRPVVIWSHGKRGSGKFYDPLCDWWVNAGYAVIRPTHEDSASLGGSDDATFSRCQDIRAIFDQRAAIFSEAGIAQYIDINRVGIGGHSFGARTAAMLAGMQMYGPGGHPLPYPKVPEAQGFIAISPPGQTEYITADSYRTLTSNMLLATGTNDSSKSQGEGPEWRVQAWEGMPQTDGQYLAWFKGADHTFGGITGNGPVTDPAMVRHMGWVTRAMWDAYLGGDARSLEWLKTDGVRETTGGLVWMEGIGGGV